MATFSSSIISKQISKLISTKPLLISSADLDQVGSSINLVGFDPMQDLDTKSDKSFSPRLINWVEPYLVGGVSKTLFYTEFNSGLKVGDRVFIINGNYDSDILIKSDKYKKGRDGYKVLNVDKCKIVLDIDYTGILPWNDDLVDNFINIYYIDNDTDFLHVNRQITTRGGSFDYKFNQYQNNIIYTEQDHGLIQNWGETAGLTGSPGFFVKNGTFSWVNITNDFIQGSYSVALSPTYSNNNRVKIHNGTFTHSVGIGVVEFKEGFVYNWTTGPEPDAISGTTSTWLPDIIYNKPILSKGNFRDGNFNGVWNTGLYGRQDKKIKWKGVKSFWNGGTLLNTLWEKGTFDSKYSLSESYFVELDSNGIPYQKLNAPDNNGRGYNLVIDSNLESSIIENGSIINSTIGKSTTYSIVESHILSTPVTFDNKVNKAYFESCDFLGGYVYNSELKNVKANNTIFQNIKSINSHYKCSVIKDSNYLSDEIIKILGYDEFIISEGGLNGVSHKVYKFYINKIDFERLELRDHFYIKGLKFNDNSKYPINFFDKLFRISSWSEYIDFNSSDLANPTLGVLENAFYKRGIEYSAFLSTPKDNDWKYNAYTDGLDYYTTTIEEQSNKQYSIDIIVSVYDKDGNAVLGIDFNTDQTMAATTSMTMPNTIGDIIDISSAYILDSDFESGVFETSNWNSGYHIEYSNDNNITDYSYEGGYYNLEVSTNSSSIIATTLKNLNYAESGEDCFDIGNIVFINGVDYNTEGKIDSMTLSSSGSLYLSGIGTASNGSGSDFTVDIIAATIGSVTAFTLTDVGSGLSDNYYPNVTTSGTAGSGLTVDITVSGGVVISATLSSSGIGYSIGNIVEIDNYGIGTPSVTIDSITNGEILSATISNGGIGYVVGDVINIDGGDGLATVTVLSTTGSIIRLSDTYKITNNIQGVTYSTLTLQEVNTSIISTLLDGGIFYTKDANNRWGYIYRTKFKQAKIKSGLLRRSYLSESLIENDVYDVTDRDFNNLPNIKNLIISDSIFTNNSNTLSKALYINSNIVNGSDSFINGIVYNSIWNGSTFSNGTFKQSSWLNGIFNSGLFYNNRSFNATPNIDLQYYDVDRIKSYYKSGPTSSNDRYSWRNGTLNGGEFFKSDFEGGIIKNGRFSYSKFYNGTIYGGSIGDKSVPYDKTNIYNGTIENTTVENASVYAFDTSYNGLSSSVITWNNGIFNDGVFGSDIIQITASNTATWNNGTFNGGQFISNAKWKNGTFNGGKFISGYGWVNSDSILGSDYSWEDGAFNGGEFGNAELGTNSTWFSGEFNGGVFKGRVWNNGIFVAGELQGSSTYSSVGGFESSNAYEFTNSFTQSYYGLWRNGIVSANKDKFIKDKKIFTEITLATNPKRLTTTKLKNTLWLAGTFSHPNAETDNIVWLDGAFESGKFNNSSFNPFVIRNGASPSFNTNDDTCYWENGQLKQSDFYYSRWKGGKFIIGTASGMIWENGVADYMNAYNVFWENGLWRNGNWQGSDFDYGGTFSEYTKAILDRGASWSGTQSLHVWNLFQTTDNSDIEIINVTASTVSQVSAG